MVLLTISDLSKKIGNSVAINNISLTLEQGQKLAIAGETGSGKTTLLKMIGGLIQPDSGSIFWEDEPIQGPNDRLIPGHPGIAYLSQYFELRNNYWVYEILEYANNLLPEWAQQLYSVCRIQHLLNRRTHELSGGEKQRIALARLLSMQPKLLLLDEPFSNLDTDNKRIMKKVITDISAELNITCILVAHDPLDILSWAHHIIVLKNGNLIQQGSPKEVYQQPINEYCAGLLGDYNLITPNWLPFLTENTPEIKERKVFCRPEDIELLNNGGEHTVAGFIKEVSFFGPFYRVEIWTEQQIIIVSSFTSNWKTGQKLHISFPKKEYWIV